MSDYSAVAKMTGSMSLVERIAACYATQPNATEDPRQWALKRIWQFAAQPGWSDAWDYAESTANINVNPDTGARNDVIGDDKILAAVQLILNPPAPAEDPSTDTAADTSTETPAS